MGKYDDLIIRVCRECGNRQSRDSVYCEKCHSLSVPRVIEDGIPYTPSNDIISDIHLEKVNEYHLGGKRDEDGEKIEKGYKWTWQVFHDCPSGYYYGFGADAFGDPRDDYSVNTPCSCETNTCWALEDYQRRLDEFAELRSLTLTCPNCSRILVSYKYGSIGIGPLWTKEANLCLNCRSSVTAPEKFVPLVWNQHYQKYTVPDWDVSQQLTWVRWGFWSEPVSTIAMNARGYWLTSYEKGVRVDSFGQRVTPPEHCYGEKYWKGRKPDASLKFHKDYPIRFTKKDQGLAYRLIRDLKLTIYPDPHETEWKLVRYVYYNYYTASRAPKVVYEWEPILTPLGIIEEVYKWLPDYTDESEKDWYKNVLKESLRNPDGIVNLELLEKDPEQPVLRAAVASDRRVFNGWKYVPVPVLTRCWVKYSRRGRLWVKNFITYYSANGNLQVKTGVYSGISLDEVVSRISHKDTAKMMVKAREQQKKIVKTLKMQERAAGNVVNLKKKRKGQYRLATAYEMEQVERWERSRNTRPVYVTLAYQNDISEDENIQLALDSHGKISLSEFFETYPIQRFTPPKLIAVADTVPDIVEEEEEENRPKEKLEELRRLPKGETAETNDADLQRALIERDLDDFDKEAVLDAGEKEFWTRQDYHNQPELPRTEFEEKHGINPRVIKNRPDIRLKRRRMRALSLIVADHIEELPISLTLKANRDKITRWYAEKYPLAQVDRRTMQGYIEELTPEFIEKTVRREAYLFGFEDRRKSDEDERILWESFVYDEKRSIWGPHGLPRPIYPRDYIPWFAPKWFGDNRYFTTTGILIKPVGTNPQWFRDIAEVVAEDKPDPIIWYDAPPPDERSTFMRVGRLGIMLRIERSNITKPEFCPICRGRRDIHTCICLS